MSRRRPVPALFALATALSLALAARPAPAQDQPPGPAAGDGSTPAAPAPSDGSGTPPSAPAPSAKDELHAIWDELVAAKKDILEAQEEGRSAQRDQDQSRVDAAIARSTRAMNVLRGLAPKFQETFAATDWRKLDPKADEEILVQGLQMLINAAIDEQRDGKRALELCEAFLELLPGTAAAKTLASDRMADACLLAGDVDRAMQVWEKGAESDDRALVCNSLIHLGDAHAAKGDLDAAHAAWKRLLDLPANGDRRDPVAQYRTYVEQRDALVGAPAPDVDAKQWIGGEAKPLSSFRGNVVVLDFWATWCPPCLASLPGLDALAREKAGEGLVVLGLTRYRKNGYLPQPGSKDLLRDAVRLDSIPEEQFPDHLRQFRENAGVSYAFAICSKEDLEAYRVRAIPTMVVIDREGKVVFLRTGSGDEAMLRLAVERALAAKAPTTDAPK